MATVTKNAPWPTNVSGGSCSALLRLRGEGRISDEVRRRVGRDLDLEEARLEI